MDAEINSALAIFFFRLRQRGKTPRHVRANIAFIVLGHAVEFIRYEGEADVIRSVKTAERFKNRAAESGVARRISREGRSKIRPDQIAGRRA